MLEGINLFISHVNKGSRILLVIDSDCDGCGCYVLSNEFFSRFYPGLNIEMVITDRSKGYGFQPSYISDRLNTQNQPNLVITADNGITSHEACKLAKLNGIDVIITDHHQVDKFLGVPSATVIIDPHQHDCNFPFPDINGTVVYWYFLDAFHKAANLPGDMFYEFLPELCITTIPDVMPLTNMNRFIVKEGLKVYNTHHRQWVKTFMRIHGKETVTAEDLAFGLIPAINVTSRLTNAEESAMFLTRTDPQESYKWLVYIKSLNDTRKKKQEILMNNISI